MNIREITKLDFDLFWPTFKVIIEAQETYAFDPQMSHEDAYQLWCIVPQKTYVAIIDGKIAASYYIKANAAGPGSHICNCGYMVSAEFRGRGIAETLCKHSQQQAIKSGFTAMQFNSVVSTNEGAVYLWKKLGYSIIGTIPHAYHHKNLGLVDAYIMYKALQALS